MQTHRLSADLHRSITNGYSLYCLAHTPTRKLYFGSSVRTAERVQQLYYAINRPDRSRLHEGVRQLAIASGCDPSQWTVTVLSTTPPDGYDPNAKGDARPEAALVQKLILEGNAARCLNTYQAAAPPRRRNKTGPSPIAWLKGHMRLGTHIKHEAVDWAYWSKRFDVHRLELPTLAGTDKPALQIDGVPFGEFLVRACTFAGNKAKNPSRAVIADLFLRWQRGQSDAKALHLPAPHDVRAASGDAYRTRPALAPIGTIKAPVVPPKPEVSDKDFSAEALRDTEDMFAEMGWDPQGRSRG